jgi:hypothetical protein
MRVRIRQFLAVPIPQLLLSSACAIVLTMKASPTSVFPHRGLARYQFTPMSGAHKALETTEFCASVSSLRLSVLMAFPSVSQFGRSVMK